jgi:putative transposase
MQGQLAERYGTEGSPTLLAPITEAVLDAVRTWQSRPLASVSPILSFAALLVQSRQEGLVQTKAVSLAVGITMDGAKALLGWWRSESEGAKCWLSLFPELHNRGVQDCFIPTTSLSCVDQIFPRRIMVFWSQGMRESGL